MVRADLVIDAVDGNPNQTNAWFVQQNLFRCKLIELLQDSAGKTIAGLASHLIQAIRHTTIKDPVTDSDHHASDQIGINRFTEAHLLAHQGPELITNLRSQGLI